MKQIKIDGLNLEALQAILKGVRDVLGCEVAVARSHVVAALGEDDDIVAVGSLLEKLADDVLAQPRAIGVRGVDEIHAAVDGRM